MRRSTHALLVVLAALVAVAEPGARPAALAAKPVGPIQLAGKAGCVSRTGNKGRCASGRALDGARAIAVSPDGRHVYVAASPGVRGYRTPGSIAVLSRDARTGALGQASGPAGCVAEAGADGCAAARQLIVPEQIVASSDGRHVYMAGSGGLLSFVRDQATGALTQLPGEQGCFHRTAPGCGRARSFGLPTSLAISRDGQILVVGTFEYLFGPRIDSVLVFARDAVSGVLTQLDGPAGCVERKGRDGCAPHGFLYDTGGVAVTPDGTRVVASTNFRHVVLLARDASGVLKGSGCYQFWTTIDPGCKTGPGFSGDLDSFLVTVDGKTLYAASESGINVFNLTGGRFDQLPGEAGCLTGFPTDGCGTYRRSKNFPPLPPKLAASRDGKRVYTAHGGLLTFARRPDGALSQLAGSAGCIGAVRADGCARGRALLGASAVAVSPDGRHVYVAAMQADAVAAFAAK